MNAIGTVSNVESIEIDVFEMSKKPRKETRGNAKYAYINEIPSGETLTIRGTIKNAIAARLYARKHGVKVYISTNRTTGTIDIFRF